jgi:hypothetical protein
MKSFWQETIDKDKNNSQDGVKSSWQNSGFFRAALNRKSFSGRSCAVREDQLLSMTLKPFTPACYIYTLWGSLVLSDSDL